MDQKYEQREKKKKSNRVRSHPQRPEDAGGTGRVRGDVLAPVEGKGQRLEASQIPTPCSLLQRPHPKRNFDTSEGAAAENPAITYLRDRAGSGGS